MSTRHSGALEAIDRILNRGGDADEVLRAVVATLRERGGFDWAGIAFVDGDGLLLGPQAGQPKGEPAAFPVSFGGAKVAELRVSPAPAGPEETAFVERVALIVSPHCLVGWDTGGEAWEP